MTGLLLVPGGAAPREPNFFINLLFSIEITCKQNVEMSEMRILFSISS